jgi:hypothetical protein
MLFLAMLIYITTDDTLNLAIKLVIKIEIID